MTVLDGELEMSPLGGDVSRDGYMVKVYIYRFAGTSDNWTVEVVDRAGYSTIWDGRFSDDLKAYEAFEQAVVDDGFRSFLEDTSAGH